MSIPVSASHKPRQNVIDTYNCKGYMCQMYSVVFHQRRNGSIPYEEYAGSVYHAGEKTEAARIRAFVERLGLEGSQRLVGRRWAEKMNDV